MKEIIATLKKVQELCDAKNKNNRYPVILGLRAEFIGDETTTSIHVHSFAFEELKKGKKIETEKHVSSDGDFYVDSYTEDGIKVFCVR